MQKAARLITEIFAPAVLITAFLLVSGIASGSWWAGLIAAVFAALGPLAGILIAKRLGKVTDHHVGDRKQRLPVFVASLVSIAVGLAILIPLQAPRLVIAGLLTVSLGAVVVAAVNAFWKLSVHVAVVTVVTVALVGVSWWWLPALLLIPLVGWSRVVLKDHTVAQVIAGVPAGLIVVLPYLIWA
ncbi:phosphatidic acid phosphatase [Acaricomes phytoseiuli]|uniref:phosphatidic acid phosphatase n=1 Tax=Acaricomes phytoseiuli TaxID=291968 RepID=UPI0022228D8B|nr:phosphatidic acid phosphatase [Acaricomes phytoseiuli]MCW1249628.1 phosphatidic acid phosphatase [Acaricomes phytoseiuli]